MRKKKLLKNFLDDSKEKYAPKKSDLRIMHAYYDDWRQTSNLKLRDTSTIYSDNLELILNDIDVFKNSKEQYVNKGIPYRRGYLFHGPPGTGKTTIAQAVAAHLKTDLRIISLKNSDSCLRTLFSQDDRLILVEDVDCAGANVQSRDDDGYEIETSASLSSVLNAIDGVCTGENMIVMFTTNDPSKLDEALMRPGRIDCKFELGYMTQSELDMATTKLYGLTTTKQIRPNITAASMQEIFLRNQDNYEGFIKEVCQ